MRHQGITTLFEHAAGKDLLSPALRKRYGGRLSFPPASRGRPYIVGNFVSTLDGVVSYQIPGKSSGGPISGFNGDDEFVVDLLRALSDAVVFGSGTVNKGSGTAHVPGVMYPAFKKEFAALRKRLHKEREPLNVILTASGIVSLDKPLFRRPHLKTLIVTTDHGLKRLKRDHGEKLRVTNVASIGNVRKLSPKKVAELLHRDWGVKLLVHEGGPKVFGDFLKTGIIDELFLTMAPQVAGRARTSPRLSFGGDTEFLPDTAPWFRLKSLKSAGDHVLLRYVCRK